MTLDLHKSQLISVLIHSKEEKVGGCASLGMNTIMVVYMLIYLQQYLQLLSGVNDVEALGDHAPILPEHLS